MKTLLFFIIWFIAVNIAECNLGPGNAYKQAVTRASRTTTISTATVQLKDQNLFRIPSLFVATQASSTRPKYQFNNNRHQKQCGDSPRVTIVARIVGDYDAHIGEFPWQAAVLQNTKNGFEYLCDGTILAEQWILTAAHCLVDVKPDDLKVAAGINDLKKIKSNDEYLVDKITMHEDYRTGNRSEPINDIALLHLSSPIDLNKSDLVNTVCLPEQGEVFNKGVEMSYWRQEYESYSDMPSSLYGISDPHVLRARGFYLRSVKECILNYAGIFRPDEMVCAWPRRAGGRKVCNIGDGSSLVKHVQFARRATLVGVRSFATGCGRRGAEAVFTRVSNYVDWIKKHMQ